MKFTENQNINCDIDDITLYINEVCRYPLISKAEERKLIIKYKNGDLESKQKLINSNLKLVISMVKKFLHLYGINSQRDFLDLIQEGNIGLILALENFDINKNFGFSTYAYYWIKRQLTIYIRGHYHSLKTSCHIIDDLKKITKVQKEFSEKNGKESDMEYYEKILKFRRDKIIALMNIQKGIASLQTLVENEGETVELAEFLVDERDTINDKIENISVYEFLKKVKEVLTEKEYFILLCRMGFEIDGVGSERIITLEELARNYGITKERIRQIQETVVEKIKYRFKNELESFFPDKKIDKTKIKKHRINK